MKKWILILTILLLTIGIVSAANLNEVFKAPNGLTQAGNNDFVDQKGHNIMIVENTDDSHHRWFENDTKYTVQKYNDTCYIGVTDENDCYILEIVEKDGTKYIVGSWSPKGAGETPVIQSNLLEFNKINKLTPLAI